MISVILIQALFILKKILQIIIYVIWSITGKVLGFMEIGAKKNIHSEYLERWAEDEYNKIDWDEQTMLLHKEQTNLYSTKYKTAEAPGAPKRRQHDN